MPTSSGAAPVARCSPERVTPRSDSRGGTRVEFNWQLGGHGRPDRGRDVVLRASTRRLDYVAFYEHESDPVFYTTIYPSAGEGSILRRGGGRSRPLVGA